MPYTNKFFACFAYLANKFNLITYLIVHNLYDDDVDNGTTEIDSLL